MSLKPAAIAFWADFLLLDKVLLTFELFKKALICNINGFSLVPTEEVALPITKAPITTLPNIGNFDHLISPPITLSVYISDASLCLKLVTD